MVVGRSTRNSPKVSAKETKPSQQSDLLSMPLDLLSDELYDDTPLEQLEVSSLKEEVLPSSHQQLVNTLSCKLPVMCLCVCVLRVFNCMIVVRSVDDA